MNITCETLLPLLPQTWGFELIEWSDSIGDDCQAIKGRQVVLYQDDSVYGAPSRWAVQSISYWSDRAVGLDSQIEPGDVLVRTTDLGAAIRTFLDDEAKAAAREVCDRLADHAEELEQQP
jgi:hypothetical protein